MFYSESGALLRVNFYNDAADFDVVTGKYIGFLAYPKKKCAIDFIDAFMDGRLMWKLYDYEALYTSQERFQKKNISQKIGTN